MANKPKFMRPALERAVSELRELQATRPVTPADVRQAARASGYSVKHIQRQLDKPRDLGLDESRRFGVTEAVIVAVFLCCGIMAQAYKLLQRQGVALPSARTFRRQVSAEMGGQLAYARLGSAGYRDSQVYLRNDYPHRMHSVLLDHTELPIYVVPRNYKHAVKPWITVVMDGATRYVLSWVVTFGRPSEAEVRAALVQAMTLRLAPDGETVVGGRPLKAVWDRGLEFLSNLITDSCLRLNVMPVALPAYSPHLKGRLERFWGTLKRGLLPQLPGYAEGPKDLRGNSSIAAAALGEDEFLGLLEEWMDDYTVNHVISTMNKTPLQAWRDDATPLDVIAEEQLWQDFLVSKTECKVSKGGIRWDTIDWWAPALAEKGGEKVEIRYLPHDRTFVEVFHHGVHLCTAEPSGAVSEEAKQQGLERRRSQRALAQQRATAANRLRRNGHETVHRLTIDSNGRRNIVEPADDLLAGGVEALEQLFADPAADRDDNPRLF